MKIKKTIPFIAAVFLGVVAGLVAFKFNTNNRSYAKENNIYYLQYGVYTSLDTMRKNAYQLDNYIYEEMDNKYYVFVGITSSLENANKIKNLYKNKNIDIYIKESFIDNKDFLNLLVQYDILLNDSITEVDIVSISNVILTDYEELIINRNS